MEDIHPPQNDLIAAGHEAKVVHRPISQHPITVLFRYLYEIAKTVVAVLIVALIIRYFLYFLIQPFVVDGNSMEPNFHNNEYLLVEKSNLLYKTPDRGDIIVFKFPLNPSLNYVKRVIGVPGDRVVVGQGKVTIYDSANPNGLILSEPYLTSGQLTSVLGGYTDYTWTVGADNYFVLGDNRDHSKDSRSWDMVPKANIVGKVWVTIYPVNDFGLIHHARY